MRCASACGLVGGEEGRRIGPDRKERDEAEIEQAGKADLEIEPHAHQDEEPDQQEHLADEIPGIERKQRKQHEGDGERGDPQGPPRSGRQCSAIRALSGGWIML